MRSIVVIAHDIRSTHNVGSLLRTADGFGVDHIYFSGITPYPMDLNDGRLPHISQKLSKQIAKTALGAEKSVSWSHESDISQLINNLRQSGYRIIGLEQTPNSTKLTTYQPPEKCALLLGAEVEGLSTNLQTYCDDLLEITMYGKKESFNVTIASAIALYALRET